MGKIVAVEYVTVDGVMENPAWSGPFFDEELGAFQFDNLFEAEALLLGRVTYEGFAEAWPAMERDEQGFADRMNSIGKFVVTGTIAEPSWNAKAIGGGGDAIAAVTALKERTEGVLLLEGSAQLFGALSTAGLIDEYRLMVYPVIVGGGTRLFPAGGPERTLRLLDARTTGSGVQILRYAPADSAA